MDCKCTYRLTQSEKSHLLHSNDIMCGTEDSDALGFDSENHTHCHRCEFKPRRGTSHVMAPGSDISVQKPSTIKMDTAWNAPLNTLSCQSMRGGPPKKISQREKIARTNRTIQEIESMTRDNLVKYAASLGVATRIRNRDGQKSQWRRKKDVHADCIDVIRTAQRMKTLFKM